MRFLRSIGLAIIVTPLVGCSAVVMSLGTNEEAIISYGATTTSLTARLGDPIRLVDLSPPLRVWDIPKQYQSVSLLVRPKFTRQADGTYVQDLPENVAVQERDYRFLGGLKRKHDVGEGTSLALMTMGLSEVVLAPAALAARAKEQQYVLTVWSDANGQALAYRWVLVQPLPESTR